MPSSRRVKEAAIVVDIATEFDELYEAPPAQCAVPAWHGLPVQVLKYLLVSGVTTGIDYAVLFGLRHALPSGQLAVAVAVAAGYLAGVLVHFHLTRRYIFAPSAFHRVAEFLLVVLIGACGLGLTEGIIYAAMRGFGWPLFLAKSAAVPIVFLWNFSARRWWVYRTTDR